MPYPRAGMQYPLLQCRKYLGEGKLNPLLIKTITKFSSVIGYQQPDLGINWTAVRVMLVIGQYASFFTRCCCALSGVTCWVFQHS